ncbi:hypothetical protein AB0O28_14650 [Microbispora sp. NPDC088329]|uniref:hypothetical protein n=1 Tax=Microbispora sp. NPDC088329 TaxID=3154869 RepID=UPI00341EB142
MLTSPASSRALRAAGLPKMVSGTGLDDDPAALINQDPPEHTRYRRIVQSTFTPGTSSAGGLARAPSPGSCSTRPARSSTWSPTSRCRCPPG